MYSLCGFKYALPSVSGQCNRLVIVVFVDLYSATELTVTWSGTGM